MSGTSLDGLDIALCEVTGSGPEIFLNLRAFTTKSYPADIVEKLKKIVSADEALLQELCILNTWIGDYHADLVLQALNEWNINPDEIDCIASHGQTVYHAPITHHRHKGMPNATLQMGDADHIARKTGILTISDFRQKHTAAGGEGAPMASLIDALLFHNAKENRLLLNIGGIANFTYLPADKELNPLTTDTGPGNTLIDRTMQVFFGKPFDKEGEKARQGTVHPRLLKHLLDHSFFSTPMPRTTGPELFNMEWVRERQQFADAKNISGEDLIATLTWLSAQTIADAIREVCNGQLPEIYLSGGGMHNLQLVEWIEKLLNQKVHSFEEIGFNPDAKEAACFAVLANELLSGEAFTINPKQNAGRSVNFGKISLPV